MAGRIVVPEFRAGCAVWLIGRSVQDTADSPKYLALRGRKPLLGWETVMAEPRVALVEGVMGWLTLRRWGLPAIALSGTHVSPRMLRALRRFERVYVLLDSDAAGQAATQRVIDVLGERALPLPIPLGLKDVNEVGGHPDASALLLRQLEPLRNASQASSDGNGPGAEVAA